MRFGLILAFFSLLTCASQAQTEIFRVEVVSYGIYTPRPSEGRPQLVTTTTTIPAKIGVTFGLTYYVVGNPPWVDSQITEGVLYPPPGMVRSSGNIVKGVKYLGSVTIGDTAFTGYTFDHPEELVPGTWTFAIWADNRKLAQMSFTVVAQ